ncbi:MAG: hypothetical protein ACOX6G_01455 [Christensenellales bacterium]|jgi:hypothetical protein|nr:hypothetical protein [Clostridiales bacterium]
MRFVRINSYTDSRFSQAVLYQHGNYLINDKPYEVEIISQGAAIVRGETPANYPELIQEFLFHAPHIHTFVDGQGNIIAEVPKPKLIELNLDQIQPSQFFIDETKLAAVKTFIKNEGDIIIQVWPWNRRYVALDGHTRLYLAVQKQYTKVNAVESETDEYTLYFVTEAQRRDVFSPKDMQKLSHEAYQTKWHRFCDNYFKERESL